MGNKLIRYFAWFNVLNCIIFSILIAEIYGLNFYLTRLISEGALPAPFLYDKFDSMMDYFNPLYWAYDNNRYTVWRSVYPPFNFLILKLLTFFNGIGDNSSPFDVRNKSVYLALGYLVSFFCVPAIVVNIGCWSKLAKYKKLMFYIIIILSTPMLFALERGNLIIFAPLFLVLLTVNNRYAKIISLSLLVNLKPYFLVLLLYFIAKKRFQDLILCIICIALVFFVTGVFLGGDFAVFFGNLIFYGASNNLYSVREILSMPTSLLSYKNVLFYIYDRLDSGIPLANFGAFEFIKPYAKNIYFIVASLHAAFMSMSVGLIFFLKKSTPTWKIIMLLLAVIANLGTFVGPYSVIIYYVIIPYVYRLRSRVAYIICLMLLALPIDIFSVYKSDYAVDILSYLSNSTLHYAWSLGFGAFVRPIANISLMILIAFELFRYNTISITRKRT